MPSTRSHRLVIALVFLFAPGACSRLLDALEEDVEARARQAAPGDIPDEQPVDPNAATVGINSVLPGRGLTTGGLIVELVGFGFQEGLQVRFGNTAADPGQVQRISETRVQCVTPPVADASVVPVIITQGIASAKLDNAFEYYEKVTITDVQPARGPSTGGNTLTISGAGFIEGSQVIFGTGSPVDAIVTSSATLIVTAPPLPRGTYAITVANTNGAETRSNAYRTFDRVSLTSVAPVAGPLAGGTGVLVEGTGFVEGTTLTLGGTSPAAIVADQDETQLATVTLPAAPAVEGAVDVTVSNVNGEASLADGFIYYDPSDTTPRIISVTPGAGLIEGGRQVHIVGVGLDDAPVSVFFGGTPGDDCTVQSDYVIVCAAPPGAPGTVDVHVVGGTINLTATGAFKYVPLRIDALVPSTGAVAGGTFARLYGDGFASDAEVYFGDERARDVSVSSAGELTLRTPAGAVGTVDVRVGTQGVERTGEDLFTYFDPAQASEWTSGGPIKGAVNVTVIDSDTGGPLEGAFVMLGAENDTPYQGFTDSRGQITLSGPDVMGEQTVSAVREEYAAFTWARTNARNLKMMLQPISSASGEPGTGTPAQPATIRGTIHRLKDAYNYGDDVVIVTTTYIDFSIPLPNAGPRARIINKGPYELVARTGEMVIIAMAGRFNSTSGAFDVHAMGFKPFFFAESGGSYDDVDILIDTPLSQTLRIELVEPPLESMVAGSGFPPGASPNTAAAFIWYDFGGMGVHPMADVRVRDTDVLLVPMPKRLPGALAGTPFHAVVGAYLGIDDGSASTPVSLYPPQSEVYIDGLVDTSQVVTVEPMLGTHEPLTPDGWAFAGGPLAFDFLVNRPAPPTVNVHAYFEAAGLMPVMRWLVATPPDVHDFVLPWFPSSAGNVQLPVGSYYYWQMMALYRPGLGYNQLDLWSAFDYRSRAVHVAQFYLSY